LRPLPSSPGEQVAASGYQLAASRLRGMPPSEGLNYIALDPGTMKKTLPLIFTSFFLAPAWSYGQQATIDSLLRLLPAMGADTGRAGLMNTLSWKYWETGQYDLADTYADGARKLSEQLGFDIGVAKAQNELGMVQESRGNYIRALEHYAAALAAAQRSGNAVMEANCYTNMGILQQKQGNYAETYGNYSAAMEIYMDAGNTKGMAVAHVNLGYVHSLQGNYPQALGHYYSALKIRDKEGNQRAIANIRTNIGIVNYRQKNFQGALKNYKAALATRRQIDDLDGMAGSHVNIGMIYQEQGKYGPALENYRAALAIDRETGNKGGVASDLASIGGVYAAQGRNGDAMDYIRTALLLSDSIGDKRGVSGAYLTLGDISMDQHRPLDAKRSWDKALRIGQAANAKEDIKDAYHGLAMADSALGNDRAALAHYKLYAQYKDSLFNEENTRKLTQAALQYEFGKKTLADSLSHVAEQRVLGAKLEKQKTMRNAALGFALLLAVGGGIWWRADRKRRKERFHKEVAELETQVLRAQMNPHFIFNALNSINAFVRQNDRDGASAFLSKFALVMRGVLENSRHAEVTLEDDLKTLRGYLDLERLRMDGKFEYTIKLDPAIDPQEVMVPPLAVQPLVENAIWHGLASKEGPGHIAMEVKRKEDHLSWSVEDDGIGREAAKAEGTPAGTAPPKGAKKTSLGMAITRSRLALLKQQYGAPAGLRYEEVAQGTRAVMDIPVILA
jgi:tetratricopeptide (TPR) repeat protein/two-component sensor histidine kinase